MAWKAVEATARQIREFLTMRGVERKGRFLVDENVDPVVAKYLRGEGFNVKTVQELGMSGRPDSDVFQRAWKDRRIIVTHDGRDFWNDRAFPLEQTHGVAVLARGSIAPAFHVGLMFGDSPSSWERHKIRFNSDGELSIKSRKLHSGAVTTRRYRFTDGELPEVWEEE